MSLTIEEYIKYSHYQFTNPSYYKDEIRISTLEYIRQYCAQYSIELVVIYSTSLYPYILERNNQYYLIWDEHFWNLYDYYLDIYFSKSSKAEVSILSSKCFSLLLIILSHTMEMYPSLSLSFAENYQKRGSCFGFYDNKVQKTKFTGRVNKVSAFSRLFVAFHEVSHFEYNKIDLDAPQKAKQRFYQIYHRLEPHDLLDYMFVYPTVQQVLEHIKHVIEINDEVAIEEFFCDLEACRKLLTYFINDNKSANIVGDADITINIAILLTKYVLNTKQIAIFWSNFYKNCHKFPFGFQFVHACNQEIKENIRSDQFLRISLLYLTFLWYCEYEYKIYYLLLDNNKVFDNALQDLLALEFVYEILFREKYFFDTNTPWENKKLKNKIFHWE